MKNKFFISFFILATVFASCDDYVDIEAKGFLIPNSVEDLRSVLDFNQLFENAGHANDYFINDDTFVPAEKIGILTTRPLFNSATANRYNLADEFYEIDQDDWDWNRGYEVIGRVNYVLQTLLEVNGNQNEMDQIRGEALIQRASAYLTLVNLYARHYAAGNPNEDETGVPLVTEFGDATVSLVRASIQEVYDLIIDDLNKGIELVNNNESQIKFKASKMAGYALLARAYLHMENYQLAADNASIALNINNTLTNYSTDLEALGNTLGDPSTQIRPNLSNTTEVIMFRGGVHGLFAVSFIPGVGLAIQPFTYLTPEALGLYDTTYDTRYTKLTAVDPSAGGARRWTGADNFFVSQMVSLTTPEVLLIRAESNARLGNISASMNDLNYLRLNRFDTTDPQIVNLTANSTEEAIEHALDERRRELVFKGRRFFDMKRLNAVDDANLGITRTSLDGIEVSLPSNDLRWAMPIPPVEILLNPQITQNPR